MNFLDSIIYGIVEGLTEFLPVSSTGHLMLTAQLLGGQTNFLKTFEIIIQLGAILAVVALYWRKFLMDFETLKRVIIAFIPTGILGLAFYKIIKTYLLSSNIVVVWSLLIGGVVLIIFELLHKEKNADIGKTSEITYSKSIFLGLFQSIAMIPGVSRSAATIIGGLSLGIKRKTIVEFSFLLAVPTMLAATGLDLLKNASSFTGDQTLFLIIGFTTAFLVAILAIKFFIKYIQKHTFISFGIYRIVAAVAFYLLVLR